jgi:uncharacterized membrane protein YfcA
MALLLLYPQLPMARVIGSDIAHAVPLTLVAGTGHWMMGSVDWHLMGSLLAGSLLRGPNRVCIKLLTPAIFCDLSFVRLFI